MTEAIFRPARAGDERALKQIWSAAFGDPPTFIDDFFRRFFSPKNCVAAEFQGGLVSAMYALRGLELIIPGREALPAAYLYALGTLPGCRGRGFGQRVAAELCSRMYGDGAAFCFTMPATEGLYRWYERCLGARAAFRAGRARVAAGPGDAPVRPISAKAYLTARETLLSNTAHIRFSLELIEWQESLARTSGGGLFAVGGGVAAVERRGAALAVKELLLPPDEKPAAAARALMRRLPAAAAELRAPENTPGGGFAPVDSAALLPSPRAGVSVPAGAYFGLVFD